MALVNDQKNRIHPRKFTLWIALASIVMMFTAFTSAYIIKRNLADWITFDLPRIFIYSTVVILVSSLTIIISRNYFRQRDMIQYRIWLMVTLALGITFVFLQYLGFIQLWHNGFTLTRNVSFSFLYVIVGLHAIHVLGGVVAMAVMVIRAFSVRRKSYSQVPVDMMNTYWHFVDLLWIYLWIFLYMIR